MTNISIVVRMVPLLLRLNPEVNANNPNLPILNDVCNEDFCACVVPVQGFNNNDENNNFQCPDWMSTTITIGKDDNVSPPYDSLASTTCYPNDGVGIIQCTAYNRLQLGLGCWYTHIQD